jgi:hypothetical protein
VRPTFCLSWHYFRNSPDDVATLRRSRQRPWKRDTLPHKLGAAHQEAGRAWSFVKITVPKARQPVNRDTFRYELWNSYRFGRDPIRTQLPRQPDFADRVLRLKRESPKTWTQK